MLDDTQWLLVELFATNFARRHGRLREKDDFIAEAHRAVFAEIKRRPELSEATGGLLFVIVKRRLIDWYRDQTGFRRVGGPSNIDYRTVPLEILKGYQPPAPDHTAEEEFDLTSVRQWLLGIAKEHQLAKTANAVFDSHRWEVIIEGILNETSHPVIAKQLGVTESRVSQLKSELRGWAMQHRRELGPKCGIYTT